MMKRAFEIDRLIERRRAGGDPWLEFLRVPALSAGLYVLEAGAEDAQEPHTEDEVYYVVSGRAMIHVDGVDSPVKPGSLVFVPARAIHRFHGITETLTALVLFAPAEGSGS